MCLKIHKCYGISKVQQDAFLIRQEVFIKEQAVPFNIEYDELEPLTTQYVGYIQQNPVTTARILNKKEKNIWYIQRVATLKSARHKGYAKQIMQHIIDDAKKRRDQIAQTTCANYRLSFL